MAGGDLDGYAILLYALPFSIETLTPHSYNMLQELEGTLKSDV